ncbi:MAG: preprotein translocase subunit YajC [Candidatus Omnitrophica bacterium]|nr:preprotein translocase subunit YajC [Candidatus Omnitrophota bacterium]
MPQAQGPGIIGFLPLILIFVIFYVLIILPQRKQQKQHKEMIQNLQKNDEVVTLGGLHGVIVNIKEKTFSLRVDDNTKVEIDKTAVSYKVFKDKK